jgi:hypothetical protein
MVSPLKQYSADHRYLVNAAARQAGFSDPVAIDLDEFHEPVVKFARRKEFLPVDGVLVRDWDSENRRLRPGVALGMRLYEIEGVRFVQVRFVHDTDLSWEGMEFVVVDRKDYRRFYRIALRCRRDAEPPSRPPVLASDQAEQLWANTVGYLEGPSLHKVKEYGGRPRRGVLLTGPPGNGKTMACRWLWEECRRRRWEWRLVTPDAYRVARRDDDPVEAVKELFSVERRGIIFFDDMDQALRDRETVHETEDQAVFLTALDGIVSKEGVVFVFTTNCDLRLIDRAFTRPGRIDLILHFRPPDAALCRQLVERWHADIRAGIDLDRAVATTDGFSFAEIEELKNLLIMHFMDTGAWDWDWALRQFALNRSELHAQRGRQVGFHQIEWANHTANGDTAG